MPTRLISFQQRSRVRTCWLKNACRFFEPLVFAISVDNKPTVVILNDLVMPNIDWIPLEIHFAPNRKALSHAIYPCWPRKRAKPLTVPLQVNDTCQCIPCDLAPFLALFFPYEVFTKNVRLHLSPLRSKELDPLYICGLSLPSRVKLYSK